MSQLSVPCTSCGACCATFRVAFRGHELDRAGGGRVPAHLAVSLGGDAYCMRGTDTASPRCLALLGQIGSTVSCSIYPHRPSACREFAPTAARGQGDPSCGDARRRHGLPPLPGSYEAAVLG